ncbi:hypothetical protein HanRHA438_Chr05g0205911 [Helianthus annuus]|uniref:DUF4283 domain-containing protein n=1 Tax=Helianthus annuus TaxID=4232 RepID=A0A9K3IYH0_HELAN|nr:hypothetical protein HanXRQr2_Chr05g0196401 [Helianthus annuus]KAJ0583300.1 hypothetical protein HanHA89_Chr05g0175001 [Helianthus annuus]KAJ0746036.1 hypothetical protein HanOQP8_Chr05g0172941 [Helianthus annuus]KAJ0749039.1 hypothetical protein HanLR1_Chr05g0165221 [Helianthus annuus]KAJ0788009.1 hypothetical protein HanPI659440_Chr05g0186701 [Helianthus annuus]
MLLLKFNEQEEASDFLLNQEVWKRWFSDMWEGQTLPYERVAWLKLFGVPLHLADNSVFNNIAKEFGVIVQPAQLSIDDGDLSFAGVGVLVGDGKVINESVSLVWKNRKFKVWIVEDNDVWIPDCMGVVGLKFANPAEEFKSPSPVAAPVEVDQVVDIQKSPEVSGEVEESLLHGDEYSAAAQPVMGVGPESNFREERENTTFAFLAAEKARRPKRPKLRSPFKNRSSSVISSPPSDGRARKRPRPSTSNPFDLDRFINN